MDRRDFFRLAASALAGSLILPAAVDQVPLPDFTMERSPNIDQCWLTSICLVSNEPAYTIQHTFAIFRLRPAWPPADRNEPWRLPDFTFDAEQIGIQLLIGDRAMWAGPLHFIPGHFQLFPPQPQGGQPIIVPAGTNIELRSEGGDCRLWLDGLMADLTAHPELKQFQIRGEVSTI